MAQRIYVVQTGEMAKKGLVKIGMTASVNSNRLSAYGSDRKEEVFHVRDALASENELRKKMEKKYGSPVSGRETYKATFKGASKLAKNIKKDNDDEKWMEDTKNKVIGAVIASAIIAGTEILVDKYNKHGSVGGMLSSFFGNSKVIMSNENTHITYTSLTTNSYEKSLESLEMEEKYSNKIKEILFKYDQQSFEEVIKVEDETLRVKGTYQFYLFAHLKTLTIVKSK